MRFHPFDLDPFVEAMNKALKGDEEPFDTEEWYEPVTILPPLIASPYLSNLRAFKLGYSDSADQINHTTMCMPFESCTVDDLIAFIGRCPRLEELYLNTALSNIEHLFVMPTLGNLRVLQYFYGSDYTRGGRGGRLPALRPGAQRIPRPAHDAAAARRQGRADRPPRIRGRRPFAAPAEPGSSARPHDRRRRPGVPGRRRVRRPPAVEDSEPRLREYDG